MGDVDHKQESAGVKVGRYVVGLSLIVLSCVLAIVVTMDSPSNWWLFGSAVLVTVGFELSVGPEIRAWNERNKARIAQRDARVRAGFDSSDQ